MKAFESKEDDTIDENSDDVKAQTAKRYKNSVLHERDIDKKMSWVIISQISLPIDQYRQFLSSRDDDISDNFKPGALPLAVAMADGGY